MTVKAKCNKVQYSVTMTAKSIYEGNSVTGKAKCNRLGYSVTMTAKCILMFYGVIVRAKFNVVQCVCDS